MKKIPVDQIENSMVLARDICGPSGNILLGSGSTVSSAMGRRLKHWGISHVFVEGEEETATENQTVESSPEEIRKKLEYTFSSVLHNPVMRKIFDAALRHRMGKA